MVFDTILVIAYTGRSDCGRRVRGVSQCAVWRAVRAEARELGCTLRSVEPSM